MFQKVYLFLGPWPLELATLREKAKRYIKEFLSQIKDNSNDWTVLFFYDERWPPIYHARMRIGCSKLNYHLCCNLSTV